MKVFRRRPPPELRRPCALTIGNFDGVHRGHQALIAALVAEAKRASLRACVLTFEPHPREYFAERAARAARHERTASPDDAALRPAATSLPPPVRIANLRDKLEALAALGVEQVCVAHFGESLAAMSPEAFVTDYLVEALDARRLLIGDDFRFGARRAGDFDLLRRIGPPLGLDVTAMPTVRDASERISSSVVREALAVADFERARHLLGRPYRLSGRVVRGRQLGRSLGYPTLNLRFAHGRPAVAGIFVVTVSGVDRQRPDLAWPAVASVGTRPAVEADGEYLLEVHLLDWQGDAYGTLARVEFLARLREERSFPDLDALARQIDRDAEAARRYFRLPSRHVEPQRSGA